MSALRGVRLALLVKQRVASTIQDILPSKDNKDLEVSADMTPSATIPHVVTNVVAEEAGQHDSIPPAIIHEIGGSSQAVDEPTTILSPRPYIPTKDRLVTVEDSTLEDTGVAFGLETSITLSRDRVALEAQKTFNLSNCLVIVRLLPSFICLSFFNFFSLT